MTIATLATALLFACAAVAGIVVARAICARIAPLDDGPPTSTPNDALLVGAAAICGAVAARHGIPPAQLGMLAIASAALTGATWSDCARGVIPDIFTIVPLGLATALAIGAHDWPVLISALVVGVPFALAAFMSHGRGMGWGDVKLAALAGALLGMQSAVLAMAVASFAAAIGSRARPVPKGQPIAFAPYLCAAVAAAIALRA